MNESLSMCELDSYTFGRLSPLALKFHLKLDVSSHAGQVTSLWIAHPYIQFKTNSNVFFRGHTTQVC